MSENNLPALQAELERLASEAQQWSEVEASQSTAMVHVGGEDPEAIRDKMLAVRREASEKATALTAAAEEVRNEIRAVLARQQAEMEAQMRAAMAALAPLKEQVARMEEGVWTISLYLGVDEEIVTLRTGTPVPVETPLTLRTQVLAMDEEIAAFPVRENGSVDWQGMDFRDVEAFDRWLTEDPEHLAQVLPEPRGIVVFTPRRTEKIHDENPLINAAMNEANFESYWLIRNGENLYRMSTNFLVGRTLMPAASEFTALFQTRSYNHQTRAYEMVAIQPGTREWEEAEKAQDARRRHYMRVALIVQGLIDRTEVFAPLHPAANVMVQATYDDGLVAVIDDTDNTLTTAREPYREWIKRLSAELRPGMRVMGNFRHKDFRDHPYDWNSSRDTLDTSKNLRLSPKTAQAPASEVLHYIESKRTYEGKPGLVIRYERTEQVWDPTAWVPSETRPGWGHRGAMVTPKKRASAVILPGVDTFVIPYDLVTEAEMQAYLDARSERHAYADSFPLLQAAIAAKRAEAEAEAPFRDLLARVLAEDTGHDVSQVREHLDALVHRFKLGNKWHRPLVSMSPEEEAKALRLIRAEYQRIARSGATNERDATAVQALRAHDPSVMFVGRLSSGNYVAFAPQPRQYGSGVAAEDLWVREHTTTKTARTIRSRDWVIPGVRGNKMSVLFEDERWKGWDRFSDAKTDLRDDEIAAAHEQVIAQVDTSEGCLVLAVEHERARRRWRVWTTEGALPASPAEQVRVQQTTWQWSRAKDGSVALRGRRRGVEDLDMSYGGNRGLGGGIPAAQREVYMPWHTGEKQQFGRAGEARTPAPSVVWEAPEEVLSQVVEARRINQQHRDDTSDAVAEVWRLVKAVNRQQVEAKVAAARAEFLESYPDEQLWEERKAPIVKKLRPEVDLTRHTGFRDPVADPIKDMLTDLILTGHRNLEGLTVREAYALVDRGMPEMYEPISDLILGLAEEGEQDA